MTAPRTATPGTTTADPATTTAASPARAAVARAEAGQATPVSAGNDYTLGVADKVRVIIFDEPSLSGEFFVNANGRLSLPLIGDVDAAGVNTTSLAATIQEKLADGYLRQPRVSIDVLTFRPYYILGEVNKPGEYPYSSGLTVLNAVATAEGFTYRASKKSVVIKHAGESTEEKVDLSPDLRVRPGDTIRIRERLF
ncbi:polysaccharide biosynthesis/export family protein [Sphingomonas carotinifaciens]|nr:polysaccharide biosynthesis/export family protein [Sphingomonas carotinifaciens]MBB4087808.1 polysaccharide export outer membrane protein [Sphingomonas carotinifaciens]MWC42356.1 polysaccharide export protein [Sphingomonas carotinifaciens]